MSQQLERVGDDADRSWPHGAPRHVEQRLAKLQVEKEHKERMLAEELQRSQAEAVKQEVHPEAVAQTVETEAPGATAVAADLAVDWGELGADWVMLGSAEAARAVLVIS